MVQSPGADWQRATAQALRLAIRRGAWRGPTTGLAVGYAQANLVILPGEAAEDFAAFCRANPRPCPLLAQTAPGDPEPRDVAPGADLRTDVPGYRVFRQGVPLADEPEDVTNWWTPDAVGFLLGCSFTFERALVEAGLEIRHQTEGCNVSMYRTNIACQPAGRFAGPLVVSMRPFAEADVPRVREITARYPRMHGAPVHVGDPHALGIADLARPEFGDPVTIRPDEVPVFWACGVTPQLALAAARPAWAITHRPGGMFVTDLRDEGFEETELPT